MPRLRRSRGEGSFQSLPDGRIRHRLSLGFDAEGRRMRLSVYGRTKVECRELMALKLAEVHKAGGMPISDDVTLGDWLERWLPRKEREIAGATHSAYESAIRIHIAPFLARTRLDRLTVRDVGAWLERLAANGVGGRARQYARMVLGNALNDAMRDEILERNVASLTRMPRHEKMEFQAWDVDEALTFLRAAQTDRFHAFWVLWLTIGARPHEMLGLRPEDVDLESGELHITQQLRRGGQDRVATKTKTARRTLKLTALAINAIKSHRSHLLAEGLRASPWIFPSRTGTAMSYRNLIEDHYERIIKQSGVRRIRPYDLRHTYATLALKAGVPVKVVSETMGHRDIALTLRTYAHVLASMRDEHIERIQLLFGGETLHGSPAIGTRLGPDHFSESGEIVAIPVKSMLSQSG